MSACNLSYRLKRSGPKVENTKVFEQKGDLLNFKANIDPRSMLGQVNRVCQMCQNLEIARYPVKFPLFGSS